MHTPYLIGITGGSASGKTTFLRRLLAAFPEEQICLISQDNYYHPREKQLRDDMGVENFDLPTSIDAAAYAHDVLRISQGQGHFGKRIGGGGRLKFGPNDWTQRAN